MIKKLSSDDLFKRIEECAKLQDANNRVQNCEDWVNLPLSVMNNPLAAVDELHEIYDHIPKHSFSWWTKSATVTDDNRLDAVVEVVDAFHFMLSQALVVANYEDSGDEGVSEWVWHEVSEVVEEFPEVRYDENEIAKLYSLALHELTNDDSEYASESIVIALQTVLKIPAALGYELSVFFDLYLAKNTLNTFRGINGYKTGEYVKECWAMSDSSFNRLMSANGSKLSMGWDIDWFGGQDNKFLYKMITNRPTRLGPVTQREVRDKLELAYKYITRPIEVLTPNSQPDSVATSICKQLDKAIENSWEGKGKVREDGNVDVSDFTKVN